MTKSLVLVATLLFASHAHAVPRNTVKAHIDKAMKAHKEGKFDVALDELKAAYSLDPKPDLLFAIAQVYVKLDKCDDAVSYYEKFLATTKDPQAKQVVTQAIDACKSKSPAVSPPVEPKVEVVEPKVEVVEPKVEVVEPKVEPMGGGERKDDPFASGRSTTAKRSPWYKDPLGDALVIGGVAAAVGGFVMFSGAGSESDKADAATDQDVYRDHRDKAESKEKLGIVFSVAAGVLITGGVVRYVTRGGKKQETRVGVTPARDGGFVTLLGRF
jgi:tetratricopeptide (TPR) repeat protein